MVSIKFTDHAKRQMRERSLSKKVVISSIQKADFEKKQHDGRLKLIKVISRKPKTFLLIIIVEKIQKELKVITVFKTSKAKKYL